MPAPGKKCEKCGYSGSLLRALTRVSATNQTLCERCYLRLRARETALGIGCDHDECLDNWIANLEPGCLRGPLDKSGE